MSTVDTRLGEFNTKLILDYWKIIDGRYTNARDKCLALKITFNLYGARLTNFMDFLKQHNELDDLLSFIERNCKLDQSVPLSDLTDFRLKIFEKNYDNIHSKESEISDYEGHKTDLAKQLKIIKPDIEE